MYVSPIETNMNLSDEESNRKLRKMSGIQSEYQFFLRFSFSLFLQIKKIKSFLKILLEFDT
jgi:hypothetical protein